MKLLIIILLLTSCSVTKPEIKYFRVVEVSGKTFVAVSGKLKAVFLVAPNDSIYVNKIIAVSRANFIK